MVDVRDAASGWGRVGSGPSVRVVFSVWGVPSACVNFKARWWWWDDAGAVAVEVTRLLHFGEFEVEQVVDPVEELRASHEERGMLEPDGRRVRRSHRRDLDSGGDGARWFAVRACDAGFGVDDDDDARAVFASRDGGGAPVVVLGLARGVLEGARGASLSSRCQPRPLVPPSREKKSLNSTLSCRDSDERPFLLCCKKCSVAKNANSADSGPIKTAPRPNPKENDVSKNVVLNCWIPCSGWAILRAVCDSTRALDPAESHSTRDPIPTPPRSSDEPAPWLSSRGCASPPPPKKLSPPEFNSLSCNPPPGVFVA